MPNTKSSDVGALLGSFIPPGVIMPYAGASAPAGWLLCNGAEYSQTTYADLYGAISATYNNQTNPTTGSAWASPSGGNFRVPDYRGVFLRGTGTPSGLDTVDLGGHQLQKTKQNGLSLVGAGGHGHSTYMTSVYHDNTAIYYDQPLRVRCTGGNSWGWGYQGGYPVFGFQPTTTYAMSPDSVIQANGVGDHGHTINSDNETRPINKGVNYIIKY